MHQFVDAGIARYNPDKPDRPVNSPKAVYQIAPAALTLLCSFGTKAWQGNLATYLGKNKTLAAKYAMDRKQNKVSVQIAPGKKIKLSPGEHSKLIRAIVEDFGPRFAPGSVLVYAGDTGDKWGYFDAALLKEAGRRSGCAWQDARCRVPLCQKELALVDRVRHQSWPGRWQATCRADQAVRGFQSRAGLCDCVPESRHHGQVSGRNRLGNGSMGGGCAIALDTFQWGAVSGAVCMKNLGTIESVPFVFGVGKFPMVYFRLLPYYSLARSTDI